MSSSVDFMRLFDGNRLAYGGDEGKAVRCTPKQWATALGLHYREAGPAVGVYPMALGQNIARPAEWLVKWGCVDFDIKSEGHEKFDYETEAEAHTAALNLQRVLDAFGIVGWIERTRSHGRHVWIFCHEWIPAIDMRRCLLVATDIAGVSQREVNPKSDGSNLTADQLGNYVRLPQGNGPERCILDEDGEPRFLSPWVEVATNVRAFPHEIQKVAALYREPPPVVDWAAPKLDDVDSKVPRVVRHVIENGPNDGDRSKGLLYIAHECKKAGLSPQQALELVFVADEAWGKYVGRRDREQRLTEVVERAWK